MHDVALVEGLPERFMSGIELRDIDAREATTGVACTLASDVRISPIARRVAESLGVDISKVQGTGRNGRISKDDVEAHAARAGISRGSGAGSSSEDRAADPGVVRADNPSMRVKMSSTRATIARRLGAASSRRWPKPISKSRATPNPVNTPPNALDWISTKTNWNAV